jgi:hypothetical protein
LLAAPVVSAGRHFLIKPAVRLGRTCKRSRAAPRFPGDSSFPLEFS